MKPLSVYDLTYYYLMKNYNSEPSKEVRNKIMNKILIKLKHGWTDIELYKAIKKDEDLDSMYSDKKYNILPNKFHYHNQLRITPEMNVKAVDDIELEQVDSGEHYLEMRASYTLDELFNYYIDTLGLNKEEIDYKKAVGSLRYLVNKYGVDLTLYMIDSYLIEILEGRKQLSSNTILLSDMIDIARDTLNRKKDEARSMRNDRFKPRKRTINYGARSKI
jgi:hypothetical protein